MTSIRVYLHGQLLSELELKNGQEYIAGRGSDSHILLANEGGISRRHLRIFNDGAGWKAQLLSRYGGLVHSGQAVEMVTLSGEVKFSVPPFEFYFTEQIQAPVPETPAEVVTAESPNVSSIPREDKTDPLREIQVFPQAHTPIPEVPANAVPSVKSKDFAQKPADSGGNLDATSVGISSLVAHLRIVNNKLKTEDVFKLEGHAWSVGRHPSSEVVINDPVVSRKHLEITRTAEGFFVTDNGSSNGSKLNGEPLTPMSAHKLSSGDVLTVRHLEMIFEIHDPSFQNKVGGLPHIFEATGSAISIVEGSFSKSDIQLPSPQEQQPQVPAVVQKIAPKKKAKNLWVRLKNLNKIQIAIAALSIVLVMSLISKPEGTSTQSSTPPGANVPGAGPTTTSLSPDKAKEVSDTFNLAKEYYLSRKYSLCIAQIEKLHGIVPFYNNSKEIDSLCHQALELEQIETDRQRREEAKVEVENKIRHTVEECKTKMTEQTSLEELNTCLQPAIELDPQSVAISDLQTQIKIRETQKQEAEEEKRRHQARRVEGLNVFKRAGDYYKTGKLRPALAEYQKFLKAKYPNLNKEGATAQRNVAAIREKLDAELQTQIKTCQSALSNSEHKRAVMSCEAVLKENPDNAEASQTLNKARSNLKREMKSLYEDAILEESLGNIESAKEKWMKIVDGSLPKDEYHTKAKNKLKLYGIDVQ